MHFGALLIAFAIWIERGLQECLRALATKRGFALAPALLLAGLKQSHELRHG